MERILYNIIIYIFEMLIAFAFFSNKYERKLQFNKHVILIGSALFITSSLVFSIINNAILNLILFFLINFIFAILCFKISIKEGVIYSVLLDAIMFLSETLTIFLISSILKIPIDSYKNNFLAYIILSTISKILYLTFSQILSFIVKNEKNLKSKPKQFLPLFIFPILTIASSLIFLFIGTKMDLSHKYLIAVTFISILYIFSCIFILIYYQLLIENELRVIELESEKRLFNLNTAYMEILQHQNNELQMVFHDTKNHYTALSGLDNIEDVRAYISKIYPTIEKKNIIKISSNKMLDLIISKYIITCQNSNINFDYEVKTANLDYIDDAELSMILNNVLDNAVEAALGSREKQIEFSLRHINHMDLLSVVNSCDNPPKHKNHQLLTTKSNTGSHGFGTKIIKKYVKKNNGKYEWFYDDIECKFHLTILFQRKDKGSGTN